MDSGMVHAVIKLVTGIVHESYKTIKFEIYYAGNANFCLFFRFLAVSSNYNG